MSSKPPKRGQLRRLLDTPAQIATTALRSSSRFLMSSSAGASQYPDQSPALVASTSSVAAVSSKPTNHVTSSLRASDADTKVTSLKGALHTIKACVSAPLLSSIVDVLVECFDGVPVTTKCHQDYEELILNISTSIKGLEAYAAHAGTQYIIDAIRQTTEELQTQLNEIKHKQSRSRLSRYSQSREDVHDLVRRYRRVDVLLRQLHSETLIAILKTTSDARLRELSPSLSAKYNSNAAAQVRRAGCTANTRRQILEKLERWANDPDGEKIYWMNGMAGTGKTTIAYSFCAKLEATEQLAASFFCSRSLPECRNAARIAPTIAHQLARFCKPYHDVLCRVLERDPDVKEQGVSVQWVKLLREPLCEIQGTLSDSSVVVVIDALDECSDQGDAQLVLECLLRLAEGLPVKYFVTCRPDVASLRKITATGPIHLLLYHLHDVEESLVKADIQTYLTTQLMPVNATLEQIKTITERSGKLFIYAATVVRYVVPCAPCINHKRRLGDVLGVSSSHGCEVYAPLDTLYTAVLSTSLDKGELNKQERDEQKLVLDTIVCAREPLTIAGICGLLGFESANQVRFAVEPLRAVLSLDEISGCLSTLHASFPDYMLSVSRAGRFACDEARQNELLARRCFEIMARLLRFNMCGLESSFVLDSDVYQLSRRINDAVPVYLAYACQYWSDHSSCAQDETVVIPMILELLQMRAMYWLETMNLKGWTTGAARVLMHAYQWLTVRGASSDLIALCNDAQRFSVLVAASPVRTSMPHLYISTLALWDRSRPMWICYGSRLYRHVEVQGSAVDNRDSSGLATWMVGCPVFSMKISHDGQRITTGSEDESVSVWDTINGALLACAAEIHDASVASVTFLWDGTVMASGSQDGSIRIWNTKTGAAVGSCYLAYAGAVLSVAQAPDGLHMISAHENGGIYVWNTTTCLLILGPLKGHTAAVTSVECVPTGCYIVSGSRDTTLRIWDLNTGRTLLGPLHGHTAVIWSVSCSLDGTYIASGSHDCTIRIWDADTGHMIGDPLYGHTAAVRSVSFSPDGQRIVSASQDHTIRVWDVQTGQTVVGPFRGHTNWVWVALFTPDGHGIISCSSDKTIRVWDAHKNCALASREDGHIGSVWSVAFSPDSRLIVSGSEDGTMLVWNARNGQRHAGPFKGHTDRIWSVVFTPDGSRIVSGSADQTVRIWDTQTGKAILEPCQGHSGKVNSVAVCPGGSRIASGSDDCSIRIWNTLSGAAALEPFRGHTGAVYSVAYSCDSQCIVSGSADKTVRMWDAQTGDTLFGPLQGDSSSISSVACSPVGNHIASGSRDRTVRVWDTQTGQLLFGPLSGHSLDVHSVTFSPDGMWIISGSYDNTIGVWSMRTKGTVSRQFRAHTDRVASVASSPDGRLMASASRDGAIRVWDWYQTVDSTSGHNGWSVDSDGWVMGSDRSRILWLPMDLRTGLIWEQNLAVIHRYGNCAVNFTNAHIGPTWAQCYADMWYSLC